MKLKQAIGVLETHNRWRRGEDVEPLLKPSEIGIAIDVVVEYIKNNGVLDDVMVLFKPQELWRMAQKYNCDDFTQMIEQSKGLNKL